MTSLVAMLSGFALAALLGLVCYLQGKLIRVREFYLKKMAADCVSALRDTVAEYGSVQLLFEDMIRQDPSIAETLQVDLLNLQEWRRSVDEAAGYIEEYVSRTDPSPVQRWRKYREMRKRNARTDHP